MKIEGIDRVSANLSERAHAIAEGGHSQLEIMKSAMADLKSLGSLSGMLAIMSSGTLSEPQLFAAQRLAVKMIAVMGMIDEAKNKGP